MKQFGFDMPTGTKLLKSLKKRWRFLTDPEFRSFRRLIRKFNAEQGKGTPTGFTGLTAESVAFDFGGYEGEWCADMRQIADCRVHVFEPHPRFAKRLAAGFSQDEKVVIHAFALGAEDARFLLSDEADASSAFETAGNSVTCEVKALTQFMNDHQITEVAATKMNIEGGEYDLLSAMIDSGLITTFNEIAIQFHDYGKGEVQKREAIRNELKRTHDCLWSYDFVWEFWRRRAAA